MASGFSACHPDQVSRLERLRIRSAAVVQGYGYATASAETHEPVGKINGVPFGHCIDLSPDEVPFSRGAFDHMVEKGFAPFPREQWSGGAHWHLVDATRPLADLGNRSDGTGPNHNDTVNGQLGEWVSGGDGLVGESPMPEKWRPTLAQRELIRDVWIAGYMPDEKPVSKVLKVVLCNVPGQEDRVIDCGPVIEDGTTRVDLRPVVEALGYVIADPDGITETDNGPRIYLKLAGAQP